MLSLDFSRYINQVVVLSVAMTFVAYLVSLVFRMTLRRGQNSARDIPGESSFERALRIRDEHNSAFKTAAWRVVYIATAIIEILWVNTHPAQDSLLSNLFIISFAWTTLMVLILAHILGDAVLIQSIWLGRVRAIEEGKNLAVRYLAVLALIIMIVVSLGCTVVAAQWFYQVLPLGWRIIGFGLGALFVVAIFIIAVKDMWEYFHYVRNREIRVQREHLSRARYQDTV